MPADSNSVRVKRIAWPVEFLFSETRRILEVNVGPRTREMITRMTTDECVILI